MTSLNARVGAIALTIGSGGTVMLSLIPELIAIRFLALAVSIFGAWAFADEMGLQKPLNRAGMVALFFAAGAKTLVLLDPSSPVASNFNLLHAFALLLALLLWSTAFLHRNRRMKILGWMGASVAVAPILLLIAGHIFIGVGAAPAILTIVELVFLVWSLLAAGALWAGQISPADATRT